MNRAILSALLRALCATVTAPETRFASPEDAWNIGFGGKLRFPGWLLRTRRNPEPATLRLVSR